MSLVTYQCVHHRFEELEVIQVDCVAVHSVCEHVVTHRGGGAEHCAVQNFQELRWVALFRPIYFEQKQDKAPF